MRNLRLLIREIIKDSHAIPVLADDWDPGGLKYTRTGPTTGVLEVEDLLTEPDDVEFSAVDGTGQELEKEASAVGAIAGVTTPLGTGPTYPADAKRKKKQKLPVGWQKSK